MASREQIERRYEGKKTIAVLFWLGGVVWFLIVLIVEWRAWRSGSESPLGALGSVALLGILPAIVLYFIGSIILRRSATAQEEEEEFRREADFLQYFHRKGRASFQEIQQEFGMRIEDIRGFVIDIAGKRLFRGYIDWKNEELVSIGEVDIGSECPGCSARLSYLDARVGICEDCGLQVFR